MSRAYIAGIVALTVLWAVAVSLADGPPKVAEEDFIVPTREDFLRRLKLQKPELAPVKAALDRGDVEAATNAYIAHFRQSDISFSLFEPWDTLTRDPEYDTGFADDCLDGHLRVWLDSYDVPETGINWDEGSLSSLTRMPFYKGMRWAIFHTQDPRYVRWCVDYFQQYMQAYPIEEFIGKSSAEGYDYDNTDLVTRPWYWGMLPHRLETVAETVTLLREYPQVSDEELLGILQRMYQETAFLMTQVPSEVERGHNGAPGQIRAVAAACAVLKDFQPTDEWMQRDRELLAEFIDTAFYPDGWYRELCTPYSVSVARQLQYLAAALYDTDDTGAARDTFTPMVTSLVGLSNPLGVIPTFGDNNLSKPLSYYVNPDIADGLELPWLQPLLKGTDGPDPPFTVWPRPGQEQWCGFYAMRSDWTEDARYMMLDCGPWGLCHVHGDRLSFVLMAYGRYFIIDPHGTKYTATDPDDFISRQEPSFLHNTITVDGVDEFYYTTVEGERVRNGVLETAEPLDNRWEHGDEYTLFEGSYSFAPIRPVNWTRRILFADGSYWLLQDVLAGDQDIAGVERNFQFEHDIEITFDGNITIATAPNGARLLLIPLNGDLEPRLTLGDKTPHTTYFYDGTPRTEHWGESGTKNSHGRGWTAHKMQYLVPAPAVTYVGDVDLPEMLTMAMVPLAPEQSLDDLPDISSEPEEDGMMWHLPVADGQLQFTTSVGSCEVQK
ncbi:MAG: alginate lyase family protein [Armatimonadota bacterium]